MQYFNDIIELVRNAEIREAKKSLLEEVKKIKKMPLHNICKLKYIDDLLEIDAFLPESDRKEFWSFIIESKDDDEKLEDVQKQGSLWYIVPKMIEKLAEHDTEQDPFRKQLFLQLGKGNAENEKAYMYAVSQVFGCMASANEAKSNSDVHKLAEAFHRFNALDNLAQQYFDDRDYPNFLTKKINILIWYSDVLPSKEAMKILAEVLEKEHKINKDFFLQGIVFTAYRSAVANSKLDDKIEQISVKYEERIKNQEKQFESRIKELEKRLIEILALFAAVITLAIGSIGVIKSAANVNDVLRLLSGFSLALMAAFSFLLVITRTWKYISLILFFGILLFFLEPGLERIACYSKNINKNFELVEPMQRLSNPIPKARTKNTNSAIPHD